MSNALVAPPLKGGAPAERIAKYLARRGWGSRRAAERIVAAGRVQVNGDAVPSPAFNVPAGAVVRVDGRLVRPDVRPVRVYLVHKLKGELVTADDPAGRPTVAARLARMGVPRGLHPVGRLDFNTEGLLLLTDDGDFSRFLEHPAAGLTRVYRVRVWHGGVPQGGAKRVDKMVAALRRGMHVEGVDYAPISAAVVSHEGAHTWLRMTLAEGKRNEIKTLTRVFGAVVVQMQRLEYGPFALGRLRAGDVLPVTPPVQLLQLAHSFKHNAAAFAAASGRARAVAASARSRRQQALLASQRRLRAGALTADTAPAAAGGRGGVAPGGPAARKPDRRRRVGLPSSFRRTGGRGKRR